MEKSPTKRFSNRVDNYAKYRPSYPKAMMDWFTSDEVGLVAAVGQEVVCSEPEIPRHLGDGTRADLMGDLDVRGHGHACSRNRELPTRGWRLRRTLS